MEPRPAATVILAREVASTLEVLVLTRSRDSSFLPGFVVFPGGSVDPPDDDLARRLFGDPEERARACALRELREEAGIHLDVSAEELVEIARWIAPEFLEMRFDARFFAARAPVGVEPAPDGSEVSEARWARPSELVAEAERGGIELMWPTLVTMRALAECRTVEEVLELRVEQIPDTQAAR